jgi:hypothetical protein
VLKQKERPYLRGEVSDSWLQLHIMNKPRTGKSQAVRRFRSAARLEQKRFLAPTRSEVRTWHSDVVTTMETYSISKPWQVINGDETAVALDSSLRGSVGYRKVELITKGSDVIVK